ncbi:MAG TPA: glycosyltransferase family 9 protein [Candidatus Acidoferrales bacterium]|nr:glycosyltransferase family 9 protein [Candidatus Acidoferrales bacterium]
MYGPRYYIRVLFYFTYDFAFLLWRKVSEKKSGTGNPEKRPEMLIVRLDAIGDYVLFRNFLNSIRHSNRFSGHRITLCGNEVWKDLALDLDSGSVDDFIWINRREFKSSLSYRWSILSAIRAKDYDVVVQPVMSREFLYGDPVVRLARAREKIGATGDTVASSFIAKFISDRFYHKLIPSLPRTTFEFMRNKSFIESLLDETINVEHTSIQLTSGPMKVTLPPTNYMVVFPGAGRKWRRWSPENFALVARHGCEKYNFGVALAGSGADRPYTNEVASRLKDFQVLDYTGKLSLVELACLLSSASLALVNDTGALHIAVAVGCPVVCVSNGNSYLRFVPYPETWGVPARFVFHPSLLRKIERSRKPFLPSSEWSKLDINRIEPQNVIEVVDELLQVTRNK